jgi:fructose-bisphosphate aldolase class 1
MKETQHSQAEENYSNREIREMFNDIKQQMNRIEAQTIKTNGRVSTLEKDKIDPQDFKALNTWSIMSKGGMIVLGVVVLPVLGFLAIQVFKLSSLK